MDVDKSGTRKEELLLENTTDIWKLRRILSASGSQEAMEFLMNKLDKFPSNVELLKAVNS